MPPFSVRQLEYTALGPNVTPLRRTVSVGCNHVGMDRHLAVQDSYPEDFAHCYGCGRYNEVGHHFKTYPDGTTTHTEFMPPNHYTGAGNFAYGGIVASVIDCHSAGSAAIFWMQRESRQLGEGPAPRFVTARLEVNYLVPTPLDQMDLIGSLDEIGPRKVIVSTELRSGEQVTVMARAVLVKVDAE